MNQVYEQIDYQEAMRIVTDCFDKATIEAELNGIELLHADDNFKMLMRQSFVTGAVKQLIAYEIMKLRRYNDKYMKAHNAKYQKCHKTEDK